ncbi:MAG: threonine/serine exporter family protein [Lachnospiraceae bacterium]|nr:threonine/serine exporter family protein [Lachnospiraceae bacterium]
MNYALLLNLVASIATKLAKSGAETYRVEESVRRITAAYGVKSQVYAVPRSLFITIIDADKRPLTQLCRMEHTNIDLESVEVYSNLSRKICQEKPDWETALIWVDETSKTCKKFSFPVRLLGYALVAFGFCLFFGGDFMDALCAAFCGLLIGVLERYMPNTNIFFQQILSAFFMAVFAYGLSAMHLSLHVDASIIGTLMLLVPGLLFTNALRDIIFGDTNSGINRVVEVFLIAAALSLGTAAAWNTADSLWSTPVSLPLIQYSIFFQCIFAIIACFGFVIVFNVHGYGNILCVLGAGLTWATYCLVRHLGGRELQCYFIATVVAALFAEIMARIRKYPIISYLIVSILPLIPGSGIYYAAQEAVHKNAAEFVAKSSNTLAIAGVMAVGILLVVTLFDLPRNRNREKDTHS